MAKLTRRNTLLAKVETTVGVDAVPSPSADAIIVENPEVSYDGEVFEPPGSSGSIGPVQPTVTRVLASIRFEVTIRGSGTNDVPPDFGPLLQACGFAEAINAGTSVVYSTTSVDIKSLTMELNVDGLLYKLLAARGNMTLNVSGRERAFLTFEFTGRPQAWADQTLPTISGTSTQGAIIVENAGFTFGGTTLAIDSLTLDMGNTINASDDINQTEAVGELLLAARNPVASFAPEAVDVAVKDFWSIYRNSTPQAIALSLGTLAGNQFALSCPTTAIRNLTPGDREGTHISSVEATCFATNDGDVVLTFT